MKFLFGLMTILFGCSDQKSVPDDFELAVSFTASQPGNSDQTVSLIRQPDKSYMLITSSNWADSRADTKTISAEDVALLYSEIISAKVFRLKNSYVDMSVLDGGTTTLRIRANKKEKNIRMRNVTPPELYPVLTLLRTMSGN